MTDRIKEELYKLRNSDGWVVVHGMAGFGKTVLAAESLRDAKLLRYVFPGIKVTMLQYMLVCRCLNVCHESCLCTGYGTG